MNLLFVAYVVFVAIPTERRKSRPQLNKRAEHSPDYQLTSGAVIATEDRRYIYRYAQAHSDAEESRHRHTA